MSANSQAPGSRKTTKIAIGLALALGGGLVGYLFWDEQQQQEACRRLEERLAGVAPGDLQEFHVVANQCAEFTREHSSFIPRLDAAKSEWLVRTVAAICGDLEARAAHEPKLVIMRLKEMKATYGGLMGAQGGASRRINVLEGECFKQAIEGIVASVDVDKQPDAALASLLELGQSTADLVAAHPSARGVLQEAQRRALEQIVKNSVAEAERLMPEQPLAAAAVLRQTAEKHRELWPVYPEVQDPLLEDRRRVYSALLEAARIEVRDLLAKGRFRAAEARANRAFTDLSDDAAALKLLGPLMRFRDMNRYLADLAKDAGQLEP